MKIKYYLLRPESKTETGLLISISYKNERLRLGIDECINPKFWNNKTHGARSTPSFPQAPEFNKRLEKLKAGIEEVYYKNFEEGYPPTPVQLKSLILKDVLMKENRLSFFEYYQELINKTANGSRYTVKGKVIEPGAAKHYKTALKTLMEFNPNLNYNDITLEFHQKYLAFLNAKGLAANTVGDHIKKIKTVMAESLTAGYHRNEAFKNKNFIKPSAEADNIYLDESELKAIENLDLSGNPSLDRVRDLFLVGAFTGLRFSDYSRLTKKNIADGFITIKQAKTGKDVTIPIHSVVKKIIKKYEGNLPPTISNQKFNYYIKDVCKQVSCLQGIESKTTTRGANDVTVNLKKWELVSSHTCRRSFCTNEYLKGMPTLTIMGVSVHKTESSFLKYLKVTQKEEAIRMQKEWDKRESKLMAV